MHRKVRNIVVLGFSMVGKTATCVRFSTNRFDEDYEPTYENSFSKVFVHKGQEVELMIKDTQGQTDQDIFRNEYGLYHGYVLVYSISSARSLDTLKKLNQRLVNLIGTNNVPRVLVGNKADLAQENRREVTPEQGQAIADEWGCAFVEASAKSNTNIDKIFHLLLDEIDKTFEPESTSKCFPDFCGGDSDGTSSRMKAFASILVVLTLLYGIAGLVLALITEFSTEEKSHDLFAYIMFGFGLVTALISGVGLFGLRQTNKEFLRVYFVALFVLLVSQLVVMLYLFTRVAYIQNHATNIIIFIVTGGVIQIAAISFSWLYYRQISPSRFDSPDNRYYSYYD